VLHFGAEPFETKDHGAGILIDGAEGRAEAGLGAKASEHPAAEICPRAREPIGAALATSPPEVVGESQEPAEEPDPLDLFPFVAPVERAHPEPSALAPDRFVEEAGDGSAIEALRERARPGRLTEPAAELLGGGFDGRRIATSVLPEVGSAPLLASMEDECRRVRSGRNRLEADLRDEREHALVVGIDPLGAGLVDDTLLGLDRPQTASGGVAGLEERDLDTRILEQAGGAEAGKSETYDPDLDTAAHEKRGRSTLQKLKLPGA
jgi:hypothetical protein